MLIVPSVVFSAAIKITPDINASIGYDDNVLFSSSEEVSESYGALRPNLSCRYLSDNVNIGLGTYMDIIRYEENRELDTENYRLNLDGIYKMSTRMNISGRVSYLKDVTLKDENLDSDLEEGDRVIEWENEERYNGGGSLTYRISSIYDIGLNYNYQKIDYESDTNIDRDAHTWNVPINRWFNDRLDKITLRPYYSRIETKENVSVDYFNLSAGWTHIFSETLSMRNYVGYGYTVQKQNGQDDIYRSASVDLNITNTGEYLSFNIGLGNSIGIDSQGDVNEVDKIYLNLSKRLKERLKLNLSASIYASRPQEEYSQVDSVYYEVGPSINYDIAERKIISLRYRYQNEEDRTLSEDQETVRNVVEISFSSYFPIDL